MDDRHTYVFKMKFDLKAGPTTEQIEQLKDHLELSLGMGMTMLQLGDLKAEYSLEQLNTEGDV